MHRLIRILLPLLLTPLALTGTRPAAGVLAGPGELEDLYFGEALFYAYQEDFFDAIVRLDIELAQHYELDQPALDSLAAHRPEAEFDVGDLELHYRMHQRAGRAIQRVLDAEHVPRRARNEAAYRLARIYFEKGYYVNTVHALDLIQGDVDRDLARRADMLRAQAQMTQGNYETAVDLLRPISGKDGLDAYAAFNLGVALIRAGALERGARQLDQVGQMGAGRSELVALRDKANLTLGNRLLEEGYPQQARPYLERVRLDGPFSNKALLLAGWADAAGEDFRRALVPWTELHGRDSTDAAVQEVLLALPYAYAQLEVFGRAALLYGEAVNEFDGEIDRLDASIESILDGRLREVLIEDPEERNSSFIESLRSAPDAPETRYLLELMASHDFQESVKNYRDMEKLRLNARGWLADIEAYQDLIEVRRRYYEPLLPEIERRFATQDALMQSVLLRRDEVARRLQNAQKTRNTRAFATQNELTLLRRLERMEYRLNRMEEQPGLDRAKARLARLQGVLGWQIDTDYDRRLAVTYQHLSELDALLEKLTEQHRLIVKMKRAAYQSFEGYEVPLRRYNTALNQLIRRIGAVMNQQARYLEKVAVRVLDRRRQKLVDYRVKARFALAESYDRATKKQAKEAEEELRRQREVLEMPAGEPEEGAGEAPADPDTANAGPAEQTAAESSEEAAPREAGEEAP